MDDVHATAPAHARYARPDTTAEAARSLHPAAVAHGWPRRRQCPRDRLAVGERRQRHRGRQHGRSARQRRAPDRSPRRVLGAHPGAAPRPASRGSSGSVGFDRLTVWHRWNGHACLDLVLAHVVFSVWGYAALDRLLADGGDLDDDLGGVYPGMITATIGTALLVAVVVSSIVIVRRRLRYESWYAIHLTVYAGDRARLVPPDPDRQRARPRPPRRRLLARRSTSRRSRCSSASACSCRS